MTELQVRRSQIIGLIPSSEIFPNFAYGGVTAARFTGERRFGGIGAHFCPAPPLCKDD